MRIGPAKLRLLFNEKQGKTAAKSRNRYSLYGFVQSHLWRMEKDPSRKIFEVAWMTPLVAKHDISANWLLTEEGSMVFKSPPDGAKKLIPIPKEVTLHVRVVQMLRKRKRKAVSD